jgi:hypothetical protein
MKQVQLQNPTRNQGRRKRTETYPWCPNIKAGEEQVNKAVHAKQQCSAQQVTARNPAQPHTKQRCAVQSRNEQRHVGKKRGTGAAMTHKALHPMASCS